MTILEFRDKVIEEGIRSVHQLETREHRIRGCLVGFEMCKSLTTPEDFEELIVGRAREEMEFLSLKAKHTIDYGDVDTHLQQYQEFRCTTIQIEHVYERMKVAWHYNHIHHFDSLSSRAVMQYAKIVGVNKGCLN